MRRLTQSILFLLAVASCPAQMMPMGLTAKAMLVQIPEIKKELKVTKDQSKEIQKLMTDLQADPSLLGGRPNMHYTMKGFDLQIVKVLDEGQNARLFEIFLQENGFLCLTEPEVSEKLGLKPEVLEKAVALIDKLMDDEMAVFAEAQKSKKYDLKQIDTLKAQAQKDIAALLNEEETKTWETMKGKPFKFPKMMRKS